MARHRATSASACVGMCKRAGAHTSANNGARPGTGAWAAFPLDYWRIVWTISERLVRILTGAMTRAMMQGDTDLAEDLASAVRRNVTVWADAYHESY